MHTLEWHGEGEHPLAYGTVVDGIYFKVCVAK